jgi:hypothetical protein
VIVSDEAEAPTRRRPWWVGPSLAGILGGAIAGTFVSIGEFPPCAPPQARVEIVVERFMARLGASEAAIRDCFTAGRPNEVELARYAAARPPMDYRIEKISEASDDRGRPWFAAVQVVASWRGDPPEGWSRDRYQWIVLRASGPPTRWTIEETRPPLPRS